MCSSYGLSFGDDIKINRAFKYQDSCLYSYAVVWRYIYERLVHYEQKSVTGVRERTIPPLVGEVSGNF
jgi:hypothetical protein